MATSLLLIGSCLSFEKNLPDYFFVAGTAMFFINSVICLIDKIKKYKEYESFYTDLGSESFI